jgi:uncharacterized membrane protein
MQPLRPRDRPRIVAFPYLVVAILLGWVLPRLNGAVGSINVRLGPDQTIAFLSAVSSGMMAFTGIVFGLLFILLQFGSTAYTPHIVPILARNRTLNHAGGVFTGTFVYSLMALRGVRENATSAVVIWVAFGWLIVSVCLLLRLVQVFATLTITDVLDILGDMGHREIERIYGDAADGTKARDVQDRDVQERDDAAADGRATQTLVHRGGPRYVVAIDVARLVAIARAANAVIHIPVAVGDSITAGTEVASIERTGALVPEEELRAAIVLGRDRTCEEGPKHAIRLLVDIAIRALSPAINDPTTAVHSLDQIEALLRRLGESDLDIGDVRDSSGRLRLVYPAPTWEDYLELGVTEIQHYGAEAVQVQRRLAALFTLLRDTLPTARQASVDRLGRERHVFVREAFPMEFLRDKAERADRQGVGHTSLDA